MTIRTLAGYLLIAVLASGLSLTPQAAEHTGTVTFNGLPVPGAKITATRGGVSAATVSTDDGSYRFENLEAGAWHLRVEMIGFAPAEADVEIGSAAPPTF